jgi:hypothetical protein
MTGGKYEALIAYRLEGSRPIGVRGQAGTRAGAERAALDLVRIICDKFEQTFTADRVSLLLDLTEEELAAVRQDFRDFPAAEG